VLNRTKLLSALLGLLSLHAVALADSYTFSVTPTNGVISGTAGSTIGWGYSITNSSSTDWLVTSDLTASPFANGTPDATLFDFPILAPGTTATQSYDLASGTGLFALTWDNGIPSGFTDTGIFTLSAEWWSGDPAGTGSFLADADDAIASYSASVSGSSTGPPTSITPEPEPFVLVFGGMLALCMAHRSRVRSQYGV
jgi:hypothetical protein